MKKTFAPLFLLTFWLIALLLWQEINTSTGHASEKTEAWEEVSQSENLTVYRKKMQDSSIFAYKGEAILQAPLERVLGAVMDTPRRTEWMERVIESKTLKSLGLMEKLDLMVTHVPWPLENRDFVFRSVLQYDRMLKKAILRLESIHDPSFPSPKKTIRGWIHHAAFEMTAVTDFSTRVVAESHIDPKGWIPSWIINLVQKSFPRKTMNRLTVQSLKPDVKPFQ